jgi:hypothetical protein
MRYLATCAVCGNSQIVNGQKAIESFGKAHNHELSYAEIITGNHISIKESSTVKSNYRGQNMDSAHYWNNSGICYR